MRNIVIVDYGSGNLRSVMHAVAAVCEKRNVILSDHPKDIASATHIILPGVGAFNACRLALEKKKGVLEALQRAVREQGRPFLGICVGMQLMAERSLEYGHHQGLGWIHGEIEPLPKNRTIPHMGWDEIALAQPHALFDEMDGHDAYFAHSFALRQSEEAHIIARCTYGVNFCAAVARDNMIGTQFHPEKSQAIGLAFLKRFLNWRP